MSKTCVGFIQSIVLVSFKLWQIFSWQKLRWNWFKLTSQHYVGVKWGESESLYWLSKTLLLSGIENPPSPRKDKAICIHEQNLRGVSSKNRNYIVLVSSKLWQTFSWQKVGRNWCKLTSQHYVGEKWGESESLYWLSKILLLSDIENPLSPRKDKGSLIHEHVC